MIFMEVDIYIYIIRINNKYNLCKILNVVNIVIKLLLLSALT